MKCYSTIGCVCTHRGRITAEHVCPLTPAYTVTAGGTQEASARKFGAVVAGCVLAGGLFFVVVLAEVLM